MSFDEHVESDSSELGIFQVFWETVTTVWVKLTNDGLNKQHENSG